MDTGVEVFNLPVVPENNEIKKTHRRLRTGAVWASACLLVIFLEPVLTLNVELCKLYLERSTWVAGLLIVGWTGTNAVMSYVNNRK
jgi:hypothetical protein